MSEPVVVPVGACRCPGTPHTEGDTVSLAPGVTNPMGVAAYALFNQGGNQFDIMGNLAGVMLRFGIVAWSFPDAVSGESIERWLPFDNGGLLVAEKATELYQEALFRPLASRIARRSQRGPMADSTSASQPSGPSHRKHSKRSLPNGSAGRPSVAQVP